MFAAGALFLAACSSSGASLPPCDCPVGTVCDAAGDCVTCAPTDPCASDSDCAGGGQCTSIINSCSCLTNDGFEADDPMDHFIGDPSNTVADGLGALDIETVAAACDGGNLRVVLRLAAPALTTTTDLVSYSVLITSPSLGALPGGLLGEGVRQLSLEGEAGGLACVFRTFDGGAWSEAPLPTGAACASSGNLVSFTYPAVSDGVAGPDTGLRIYTQETRTAAGPSPDIVLDIAGEDIAYPNVCNG